MCGLRKGRSRKKRERLRKGHQACFDDVDHDDEAAAAAADQKI